jgi:hypothetical protein
MNEEGNLTFDLNLEITTWRSSTGPLKASITDFGARQNSSRKRIPFSARLTSPGSMLSPPPPPIIAGREAL